MKILKIIIYIVIIFFVSTVIIIFYNGFIDKVQPSDVIVILGNKVEITGKPSDRLKSRLDKGLELYKEKISPNIIVSGGLGKEGFDEATVMRDYLVQNGVSDKDVIVDSKGIDTFMTAKNTKEIMKEKGWHSVLIVTNYYHIYRSLFAFKKVGLQNLSHAHAQYFEWRDLYSICREVVGYYAYIFRGNV